MVITETMLNVIVADDNPVVVAGILARCGGSSLKIVSNPVSAKTLMCCVEASRPDVIVMESRLGGRDALRSLESLGNPAERPPVVIFSTYSESTHIARAAALGCHDYILKTSPVRDLIDAINRAGRADPTPSTSLLKTVRTRMRQNSSAAGVDLTHREMQVLRHVAMGLSNREIGKSLGISIETVKEHVQNILRKLSVNDRTQAAVWAVRNHVV